MLNESREKHRKQGEILRKIGEKCIFCAVHRNCQHKVENNNVQDDKTTEVSDGTVLVREQQYGCSSFELRCSLGGHGGQDGTAARLEQQPATLDESAEGSW